MDEFTGKCDQCYQKADGKNGTIHYFYGKCGFIETDANYIRNTDHRYCNELANMMDKLVMLPSIGITGVGCMCYNTTKKTNTTAVTSFNIYNKANWETLIANIDEINKETLKYEQIENELQKTELNISDIILIEKETRNDDLRDINIIELYQSNFKDGTFRITKSGTYKLMEDILVNPKPNYESPNDIGAWWPTIEDSNEYPGAGTWDGWYWLGFMAGITIECDYVTIDLNSFEIAMHPAFYLQSRLFVVIMLTNKVFIDGAGPTLMGIYFLYNVFFCFATGRCELYVTMEFHRTNTYTHTKTQRCWSYISE